MRLFGITSHLVARNRICRFEIPRSALKTKHLRIDTNYSETIEQRCSLLKTQLEAQVHPAYILEDAEPRYGRERKRRPGYTYVCPIYTSHITVARRRELTCTTTMALCRSIELSRRWCDAAGAWSCGPAGGSLSLRPGSGPRPRRCCRPTRSAAAL